MNTHNTGFCKELRKNMKYFLVAKIWGIYKVNMKYFSVAKNVLSIAMIIRIDNVTMCSVVIWRDRCILPLLLTGHIQQPTN